MEAHPQPEELDAVALQAIVRRFNAHHAFRIARTGDRLISRHRRVLEALPMLYHRNHPALPGYAGPAVPHGIAGFHPRSGDLEALRAVARSYVDPRFAPHREQLHAIYLMGSGGTIGQTRRSDIDLWVCCDKLMHAALWPKVRLIDRWAADLGLELQTFLVDPDDLNSRRRLPGSRMPMLVLDEFYRTGALMAGRFPLWWLIPEDRPDRYAAAAARLLSGRFVDPATVVDFGPVGELPAAELAQAALTELDRALATPHKSLLKLMLMEAYARSPALGVVSSEYRRRIHAGEQRPVALDPYLLLYEHVERHLTAQGRHDEVAFARRLLIGKTGESLSWRPTRQTSESAAALLAKFAAWGFDRDAVKHFSSPQSWSMRERSAEHRRIVGALERGATLVESLMHEAAANDPAAGDEVRRLDGLNERRLRHLRADIGRLGRRDPHCVPELHPALVSRRRPIRLELGRHAQRWVIREDRHVVKACRRLAEAALWAELNGANLVPAPSGGPPARALAQVLQAIRELRRPVCVLVNAESAEQRVPPWQSGDAAGPAEATLISQRNDPLDYGGFHQLHLDTLDLIGHTEYGRWRVDALIEPAAVLEGLGRLLARPAGEVSWRIVGGRERFQLAARLEQLHALASRVLAEPDALFALPFGAETVTVRRRGGAIETHRHASLDALARYIRAAGGARLGVDPLCPRLRGMLRAS